MTNISEKVLQAISTELPSVVAGELKLFIDHAQTDKRELDNLRILTTGQQVELDKFRAIENQENDLKTRQASINARERKLELDEAVFKAKNESESRRIEEIRGLVQTVFQSNRLNYNLNLGIPNEDKYGNNTTKQIYGNIEKDSS